MFQRRLDIFRRRRIEEEIRREMESHLALIEEEERAQGGDVVAVRQAARLRWKFGSVSRADA